MTTLTAAFSQGSCVRHVSVLSDEAYGGGLHVRMWPTHPGVDTVVQTNALRPERIEPQSTYRAIASCNHSFVMLSVLDSSAMSSTVSAWTRRNVVSGSRLIAAAMDHEMASHVIDEEQGKAA